MGSYYDSEVERQKKGATTVNTILPILAALETIVTAKASRGQNVGTSTLGLIKDAHSRRADALERATKADNDAFTKGLHTAEAARASKRYALDEAQGKREASRYDREIQDAGEKENTRKMAIDRLLGIPNEYDEKTNTVTRSGMPGVPNLSIEDKTAIQLDPVGWLSNKLKPQPVAFLTGADGTMYSAPRSGGAASTVKTEDGGIIKAPPKPVAATPKTTQQIEDEAAAKARGAASVVRPMTADDQQTIKMKLNNLKIAKSQLQNVKTAYEEYKKGWLSGKWLGAAPTEAAENFETAVAALKPTIQALTKVPGMGSMSDFESKLAMAPYPEPGKYDKTNDNALKAMEDLVNQTETGYLGLTTPAAAPVAAVPEGTERVNKQGVKMRMTGGKWQPVQ